MDNNYCFRFVKSFAGLRKQMQASELIKFVDRTVMVQRTQNATRNANINTSRSHSFQVPTMGDLETIVFSSVHPAGERYRLPIVLRGSRYVIRSADVNAFFKHLKKQYNPKKDQQMCWCVPNAAGTKLFVITNDFLFDKEDLTTAGRAVLSRLPVKASANEVYLFPYTFSVPEENHMNVINFLWHALSLKDSTRPGLKPLKDLVKQLTNAKRKNAPPSSRPVGKVNATRRNATKKKKNDAAFAVVGFVPPPGINIPFRQLGTPDAVYIPASAPLKALKKYGKVTQNVYRPFVLDVENAEGKRLKLPIRRAIELKIYVVLIKETGRYKVLVPHRYLSIFQRGIPDQHHYETLSEYTSGRPQDSTQQQFSIVSLKKNNSYDTVYQPHQVNIIKNKIKNLPLGNAIEYTVYYSEALPRLSGGKTRMVLLTPPRGVPRVDTVPVQGYQRVFNYK